MSEYQLVVDTWESGGEINEQVYKGNNIAALIIRLNDMNGGHHMDTGFVKQWTEAEGFLRAPYFVYNPWVKGQANFDWLVSHCPDDANTVLVDIEVSKPLYSKSAYAAQVDYFMDLVKEKWGTKTIYTGQWFLDRLEFWPEDADYWWAQYPYALYPEKTSYKTWPEVRQIIDENAFIEPFNVDKIPGTYKMWQCTGDRLVCPGNTRIIDISIFPGTYAELATFLGYPEVEPPDPPTPPPTGEDMTIAEAIIEAGKMIAGAIAGLGNYVPPTNPPNEPPNDDDDQTEPPIVWTLQSNFDVDGEGNHSAIGTREPNTQDSNKIGINFNPGETVVETTPPPKTVYPTGGTKIWSTEAELENVLASHAYLLDQSVKNANGVSRMLLDYKRVSGNGDFGPGLFIQRKYLK